MGPDERDILRRALVSGSAASLLSSLVLAWRGWTEAHDAAAPLNGPSQWVWGTSAPYERGFSVRHTVLGYAIHHIASIGWAAIYEAARWGTNAAPRTIAAAVGTAATACFVDYQLTPRRLEPGFEKRLSRKSLAFVYVAFAAGLAAAALARRR
jgi:hypothetical protein